MSKSNSEQKPTLIPPANVKSKGAASGKTTPMENIALASVETKKGKNGSGKEHLSPVMTPSSTAKTGEAGKLGEAVVSGVTVWSPATTINSVWCINQDKNAWIYDSAAGWKQLSNLSDSGNVALTMLSSHAKQNGSSVTYRTEDDNLVHEIYVW
jgi:hypothetical protein